jgi:hypothetical protein
MRQRRFRAEDELPPTLADRLLMAVLAPVVFNVSIVIALSTFFRRSRALNNLFLQSGTASSLWLLGFFLIGVPALAGFMLGVNRCAVWLGHLFFTNMEHEKDPYKTALAWVCLFALFYLLSRLM